MLLLQHFQCVNDTIGALKSSFHPIPKLMTVLDTVMSVKLGSLMSHCILARGNKAFKIIFL